MTKVSIVGVEGSGKTVLMAVLGDKYQLPDAKGLFLSPSDQETFDFAKRHLADLRGGRWPMTTNSNRRLSWMLCRRSSATVSKICDLSLLDYPGEAFRLSFGHHTKDEFEKISLNAGDVAAFRRHVHDSQVLVLVVNLSVIVNAAPDDVRAWETQWLVKAMLDEATANGKPIALVFTRADAHGTLIAGENGLPGVITRWLPQVASLHANVPAFAVAAVDRTVPSETGYPLPTADFASQGFEPLVEWLARTAQGCARRKLFCQIRTGVILAVIIAGLGTLSYWKNCCDVRARSAAQVEMSDDVENEGEKDADSTEESEVLHTSRIAEPNPHASAFKKALDEAAVALRNGDLSRTEILLRMGANEYIQGCSSGESAYVLESLKLRGQAIERMMKQDQIQRMNSMPNADFGF